MINYLLDMKKDNINTKNDNTLVGDEEGNIVCKMEPLNLCYTLDEQGQMHPIGEHRPVRLLRIY